MPGLLAKIRLEGLTSPLARPKTWYYLQGQPVESLAPSAKLALLLLQRNLSLAPATTALSAAVAN